MYVNPEMTEEQKANVIAQLGLDKSMTEPTIFWVSRSRLTMMEQPQLDLTLAHL